VIFLHDRLSCIHTICPAHLSLDILIAVTKSISSYRRYSSLKSNTKKKTFYRQRGQPLYDDNRKRKKYTRRRAGMIYDTTAVSIRVIQKNEKLVTN
jgi:hypothetical protein